MLCNSAVKNRRATCRISALNFPYEFDILIGLRRIDRAFKTEIKPTLMALVIEWASVKHGDLTTGTELQTCTWLD